MLHLEIQFIWFAKWNYTTVLYLMTRYFPLLNVFFTLYSECFSRILTLFWQKSDQMLPNTSKRGCRISYIMNGGEYKLSCSVSHHLIINSMDHGRSNGCRRWSLHLVFHSKRGLNQTRYQAVLGLRTWAVCHRNGRIGLTLLALFLITEIISIIYGVRLLLSLQCVEPHLVGNTPTKYQKIPTHFTLVLGAAL